MRTTTVVIGAGHSGLAVSRLLTGCSIDHVVIERGEVANSWRTQRWDSLRLLTPNWQSRLPGLSYRGNDPDGYMSMPEVIEFMSGYARLVDAPVLTRTTVTSVRSGGAGYLVDTDHGPWECESVVLATGGLNVPKVPPLGGEPPPPVTALSAFEYRNPDALAPGGGAGGGRLGPRACRSPTSCIAPAVPSPWPSVNMYACLACTGAATSSGGWSARACSTSATTRSTT